MMLRYTFNKDEWAYRIEAAVQKVLQQGLRTPDIAQAGCRRVGTGEMGDAVVAAL
jgi:3-isopropylmalate dehydrogenase